MSWSSDRSVFRRLAAASAVTIVGSVTWAAAVTSASAATTETPPSGYTVSINQGNVPTTASGFSGHSCDEFSGKAADQDGWLFVASPSDFARFQAVFDGGTVYWHAPAHADSNAVSFPKPYEHLAVVTPAGYTLENAYAVLQASKNDKSKAFFTLSHTCPATQQPQPQSNPTVTFANNCDTHAIDVTLGNTGNAAAVFTLTGGLSKQDTVAPGATQPESVPAGQDGTATVTVAADHLASSPVTHTFDTATCPSSPPPTTSPKPAVTLTHGCDVGGIGVRLDNTGTASADFVVTYGGSDHHFTVTPGGSTTFTVPVANGTTKTVTATSGGQQLGSETFTANCGPTTGPSTGPDTGQTGGTTGGGTTGQHAINPAASFGTSCTSGITATLSNMKLDDSTMEPVTFTITTPAGATETVTVAADQLVKRSYPVKEDTTGTLTVTAPGMAKQTKSYAKNCTSVLGEKVSKGTKKPATKPAVQGEKVTKLPFTGVPAGELAAEAVALLGAGTLLTYAGRRRRPRGAHVRR